MFNNSTGVPLTMNVAPTGTANCNGGGFGNGMWGDGSWIFLIILFALIFGWGNGGWGGYGNGGGQSTSVYEGYVLNNDMSQLSRQISDSTAMTERKLDSITNGLCDGFYTTAQQINGVNMGIASAQSGIVNAITTNGYENRLGQQNIQTQIANCCCDLKQLNGDLKYTVGSTGADISRGVERGFADTNYNIATNANMLDRTIADKFCQTNFNAQTNTRDIVDSQNAGTQAILARIDAMENSRKDEKIAELTAKLNRADFAASQAAQNAYLVGELGYKCPQPAYVVQPPQQVSFATNCSGMATFANNGCGCNLYNGTTIA